MSKRPLWGFFFGSSWGTGIAVISIACHTRYSQLNISGKIFTRNQCQGSESTSEADPMVNQEADHKYNLKTFLILVIGFEISILGPTSIFKGTGSQDFFSNIFFSSLNLNWDRKRTMKITFLVDERWKRKKNNGIKTTWDCAFYLGDLPTWVPTSGSPSSLASTSFPDILGQNSEMVYQINKWILLFP